jgi:Holliday junction DNA helicase RuvA
MIGYLRGTARGARVVEVGGVGYVVSCPQPLTAGELTELHVVTVVREDAINLYGFSTEEERGVFEALTKVTGVGPSIALALIGGLGTAAIADAVRRRDLKALGGVKGVGAKVAEKIVTLCKLPEGTGGEGRGQELVKALTGLGFERPIATEAVRTALDDEGEDATEATLLTAAIAIAKRGTA